MRKSPAVSDLDPRLVSGINEARESALETSRGSSAFALDHVRRRPTDDATTSQKLSGIGYEGGREKAILVTPYIKAQKLGCRQSRLGCRKRKAKTRIVKSPLGRTKRKLPLQIGNV